MKTAKRSLKDRLKLAAQVLRGGAFNLLDEAAVEAFGGTQRLLWDWVTGGGDINDEIRGDMVRVRARARDLAKSNAYIKQFMNMVSVNAIGPTGYALNAQIQGARGEILESVNKKLEDAWYDWAAAPITVDGKMNLVGAQMLLAKSVVRDGEAFVRLWRGYPDNPYGLALEIIDPDLVDETLNQSKASGGKNEIRMGIEINDFGKPIAYHVWSEPLNLTMGSKRYRMRIPAEDMVHLFLPERVAQVRGYTCFYAAMIPARMLRGYTQAELVAARASAAKMGFLQTRPDGPTPADFGGKNNTNQLTMDANPGTIELLPPGLEFQAWDPSHPSTAFPEFVKSILREIASGLGVSYNALANDLEGVSYSSMRSGLLIERDLWKVFHGWWCFAFLRPVFEQWLRMALLSGELSLGSRDYRQYKNVTWTPRGWRWVDPLKDVQAGILAIKNGLSSRTQLLDEQGVDLETTLRQLKREEDLAAEIGVSIAGPDPQIDPAAADQTDGSATTQGKSTNGGANRIAALNGGHR